MENKMFKKEYMDFIGENVTEEMAVSNIEYTAFIKGFKDLDSMNNISVGDKVYKVINDKMIALAVIGKEELSKGINLVASHLDSPRLELIQGNPIIEKSELPMAKVYPYGGIINQNWSCIPLALVGQVMVDGKMIVVDTRGQEFSFLIDTLLPHLGGRKEMDKLKATDMNVVMGDQLDKVYEFLIDNYKIKKEDLEMANLSFVPDIKPTNLGMDSDLIMAYGHDDRSCAFAELKAILDMKDVPNKTAVALFVSYEETGSGQKEGMKSEAFEMLLADLIDKSGVEKDIMYAVRKCLSNSNAISADVCAGLSPNFPSHFDDVSAKIGKGVAIEPFTGFKCGGSASFDFKNKIKELCVNNEIAYQINTTKVGEGGGGTISQYMLMRDMNSIDIGVPVLCMHSTLEIISTNDLVETYKIYKAFMEEL